jgi:Inner membrane protein YgaP-like, transmembrane domain
MKRMKIENAIRVLAGSLVLISLALAHWVNPWWLLLAAFVGANLIQSAFTGFCPAEIVLKKLGLEKGDASCCG